MKKILIISGILIAVALVFAGKSQAFVKSYYSGDAIGFNNDLYVASTDMSSLEVFKLQGKELTLIGKIRPYDKKYNKYESFYDLELSIEHDGTNDHLYVYAVSDYALYKYEIVNNSLNLVLSKANTYWEWYARVNKFGNNIVTLSDKGVKVWNSNMEVIDSYSLSNNKSPYNMSAPYYRFILSIEGNTLSVFDRESRSIVKTIAVNNKTDISNRRAYQDKNNDIYVVDDYYTKKFSIDGKLLASFKHLDYTGYDVSGTGNDFIYFSNGIGVVKLYKNDLKLADYVFTGNIAEPRGWAMGLEAVYANGDKIVVFNNSNILVLDDKLDKLASYKATEEGEETTIATESLFLNLNRNFGSASSEIVLSGGGYLAEENLSIDFAGTKFTAKTDKSGRFSQILKVPELVAKAYDIKVEGLTSKLTYSIAFTVK